jgi:hypothetical protein
MNVQFLQVLQQTPIHFPFFSSKLLHPYIPFILKVCCSININYVHNLAVRKKHVEFICISFKDHISVVVSNYGCAAIYMIASGRVIVAYIVNYFLGRDYAYCFAKNGIFESKNQ